MLKRCINCGKHALFGIVTCSKCTKKYAKQIKTALIELEYPEGDDEKRKETNKRRKSTVV